MKIGISTFHFVPNSGAMLQCWALQEKIGDLGYEAEVINYRPNYHIEKYRAFKNPFSKCAGSLINRAKIIYYNRNCILRFRRNKKFREFEKNLNLSPVVRSKDEYSKIHPESYNVIVCGSDQIWNRSITNDAFDDMYFAANIPGFNGKKIAYAASVGETDLVTNKEQLIDLLHSFSHIAMREKKDAEKINQYLGIATTFVPDPTLLYPAEKYSLLMKEKPVPPKYILVYVFGKEQLISESIVNVSKKLNLPIISISPNKVDINAKYKWDKVIDPGEFLFYIANAEFIITNSFHCSVFSILFNKNFFTIKHSTRNSRIENLMDIVGIENHIVDKVDQIDDIIKNEIDYKYVNENLEIQRKSGEDYLFRVLL